MEELNKELRQCNLQQFIQQAGAPQSRTHLTEQLEQLDLMQELQDKHINNGTAYTHAVLYFQCILNGCS